MTKQFKLVSEADIEKLLSHFCPVEHQCVHSAVASMFNSLSAAPDVTGRTAALEDKVKRLVEALRKAQPACAIASDSKYDDGDEDAAQEWNMINVSVSALLAEINETSGFIGGEA